MDSNLVSTETSLQSAKKSRIKNLSIDGSLWMLEDTNRGALIYATARQSFAFICGSLYLVNAGLAPKNSDIENLWPTFGSEFQSQVG